MRIFYLSLVILLVSCTDSEVVEPENQMVRIAKIHTVQEVTPNRTFEFVGRIEPVQTVDMSFQVGGPIQVLPVLEGQTIKKGELIAALEPNDFELDARDAEAQLKLASKDLERKQRVLLEKGIAKSAVEDAETLFELRQVQVDKTQEALRDAKLVAPFDAYIGRRFVDNHANVRPLEPVVRVYDLSQLLVVTSVPEVILATATPDQIVELSAEFSFLNNKKFPLTYRENRGDADPLSQTYEVSFALENPGGSNILPGMTAKVTVVLKSAIEDGILTRIPTTALVADESNQLSVWIFDETTGMVERRRVQSGVPTGELVPIMAGLRQGEKIVSAGARQLITGMRIVPYTGNPDE